MCLTTDSYSENTESNVKAWCVGFLNTDCTDNFWGRGCLCLGVTRRVFEHGLHGLHGFFFWGRGYSLLMRDA